MKKRVLLFTLIAFAIMSVVMSNSNGVARVNGLNLTGSDGSTTIGCEGSGCHGGGTYTNDSLPPDLYITDVNHNPVGGFMPGQVYIITLKGTSDAPKWGYQISVSWTYMGLPHAAGLMDASMSNAHDTFINDYALVESTEPLPVINDTISTVVYWTAPYQSAIDTVNFFFTIVNINDDGTADGDNSNSYVKHVHHWTTWTTQLNKHAEANITAYPNPCTNRLHLSIDNATAGLYSIKAYDMQGRLVNEQIASVNGPCQASINTTGWAPGIYHILLGKDGKQKVVSVVKQ